MGRLFRILTDNLVDIGQLETKVVLSAAVSLHSLLDRTFRSLNSVEVREARTTGHLRCACGVMTDDGRPMLVERLSLPGAAGRRDRQRTVLGQTLARLKGHLIDRFSKYRDCFPTNQSPAVGKDALALLRHVRRSGCMFRARACAGEGGKGAGGRRGRRGAQGHCCPV